MEKDLNHIKLVEGIYSPADSADVLLSLIADKIKFHNLQILCAKDGTAPAVAHAHRRIQELKESRRMVSGLVLGARHTGHHLKIDGTVRIELVHRS